MQKNQNAAKKGYTGKLSALFMLILVTIVSLASSNIAKAQCPPDDEKGTWTEDPTWYNAGNDNLGRYQEPDYKYCYRYNTRTGECEFFVSEIRFRPADPRGPGYEVDYFGSGSGGAAAVAHYTYSCKSHLATNEAALSACYGNGGLPNCEEGKTTMTTVGIASCVAFFTEYSPELKTTIPVMRGCGAEFICKETYEVCWFEAGYQDGNIVYLTDGISIKLIDSDTPNFTCGKCIFEVKLPPNGNTVFQDHMTYPTCQ